MHKSFQGTVVTCSLRLSVVVVNMSLAFYLAHFYVTRTSLCYCLCFCSFHDLSLLSNWIINWSLSCSWSFKCSEKWIWRMLCMLENFGGSLISPNIHDCLTVPTVSGHIYKQDHLEKNQLWLRSSNDHIHCGKTWKKVPPSSPVPPSLFLRIAMEPFIKLKIA